MKVETGYIPISRKIFEHEFWREKRSFSRFEAWMDLLHSARFDDTTKTDFINGKAITWGRGQLVGSVRFLMERWQWGSITKVENFLKYLVNKDMIIIEKGQGINVVTICKYGVYNIKKGIEEVTEGQQKDTEKDSKRTVKGHGKDKTNKDNKVNKDNIKIVDSAEPTLYKQMVDFWLKEFRPGWTFNAVTGKALKSIIKKMKKVLTDQGKNTDDETVLNSFKHFCVKLPDWYIEKDLPVLDSKFNEIIAAIKNKQNGQATTSRNATGYDSAGAFRS
jgi:hypothetical protein